MTRILVAEDDPTLRELLVEMLEAPEWTVESVAEGKAAIAAIGRGGYEVVVSDINMPEADGLSVVRAARRKEHGPPVILLTGYGSIAGAVEAMRAGAFDYVTKPVESPSALRAIVRRALAERDNELELPSESGSDDFIAVDAASLRLTELIDRVAARDTTVLLQGESGVGKEVVARRIHNRSARGQRRTGRFVAVNCGAIPRELFEGQVFGHAKGAFSGAVAARAGLFEEAHGGTLLLDEIGDLPLDVQVKLLRALEERQVTRVGENRPVAVDVRVIAATHKPLQAEVAAGRFREDLYFRLSVFPIVIPPLRARTGDILPMAEAILRRLGEGRRGLTDGARARLKAHDWPGNVRELRNVLERAAILAGDEPIDVAHLALEGSGRAAASTGPAPGGDAALQQPVSLEAMEEKAIVAALDAEGGNRRKAADRLGIALRTLQYKIKQLGLIKR